MTSEIIERNEGGENHVVNIGDNASVSMKLVQSIYNEITGKTETLSKVFRDNHEIEFIDIKQLHTKICQLYEQYNVVSKNCSITVYHVNDCKEQFSSFERFEFYDSSNTNPSENIRLEYNFLIILPETKKAQPYKITIDLHSRVALRKKAEGEHGIARQIIRLIASKTGNIEIDYVDYTVARNFMITIDQWYKSVNKNKSSNIVGYLQDKSSHFQFIFKVLTSLIVTSTIFYNRESFIQENSSIDTLFSAGLVSFSAIYLSGIIAAKFGNSCEQAIDSHQAISGLILNRGDKIALDDFKQANRKSKIKALLSITGVIIVNIFSTLIIGFLGIDS